MKFLGWRFEDQVDAGRRLESLHGESNRDKCVGDTISIWAPEAEDGLAVVQGRVGIVAAKGRCSIDEQALSVLW